MRQFTDAEGAILRCLWEFGEQSAREIHERVAPDFDWAYSTTRSVLSRMVQKELLERQSFHRLTIYRPGVSKARAFAEEIMNFSRRLLDLDTSPIVSMVAEKEELTEQEVEELRQVLRERSSTDRHGES